MQIDKRIIFSKPESKFDKDLEQALSSAWNKLTQIVNQGIKFIDNFNSTDFVDWTDYSNLSDIVGWSSYSIKKIYYKKIGKTVFVSFDIYGVGDAITSTFTLPYATANTTVYFGGVLMYAVDNGAELTGSCAFRVAANSSLMTCYTNMQSSGWTAANNKRVIGSFWYEAAE